MGILNNAHGLLIYIYIDSSEDFISVYIFLEDMNILTHYIWITIAGGDISNIPRITLWQFTLW